MPWFFSRRLRVTSACLDVRLINRVLILESKYRFVTRVSITEHSSFTSNIHCSNLSLHHLKKLFFFFILKSSMSNIGLKEYFTGMDRTGWGKKWALGQRNSALLKKGYYFGQNGNSTSSRSGWPHAYASNLKTFKNGLTEGWIPKVKFIMRLCSPSDMMIFDLT